MARNRPRPSLPAQAIGLLILLALSAADQARALVEFDFEPPYLVHPEQQVWDFSLIREAGQYHIFYHTIPQQSPHPANADTIWHAVSPDLRHWEILGPALTSGPDWYDEVAMWAPDVVYDEATGRWAMLYTGVAQAMVQRACLAWSDDLVTWNKGANNPVFEPDSLTYHWAPAQAWSSFRDPFIYHDGAQWNMLSTAGLRLGGYPGYRRGIVHRAVSSDLENWNDAGVFYEHDGEVGRTRDLESVQYLVRDGWHHLFFVEQDLAVSDHPTSHLVAADPAGWTMATRQVIDAGWAPEIRTFDAGASAEVFARLAKDQDPRDESWFVAVRFDSLRFSGGGQLVEIVPDASLVLDWPTRIGAAGTSAATYGENAALRHEQPLGSEGNGWFSSYENYRGPLGGVGVPGAAWGDSATGRIESRTFVVTGDYLQLKVAGGHYPETCYIALLDDETGAELSRLATNNQNGFSLRQWSLAPWLGQSVRLAIVDEEMGPAGWIAVDSITEQFGDLTGVDLPSGRSTTLMAWPNPFNPTTTIRFNPPQDGEFQLEIHDPAGRLVWRSPLRTAQKGESVRVVWRGCDLKGRAVASGTYLCRMLGDGQSVGSAKAVLLR